VTIVDVQLLVVIELDGRNRDEGIVDLSSVIARLLGDRVWETTTAAISCQIRPTLECVAAYLGLTVPQRMSTKLLPAS
jgi:hypothetical protein